MGKRMKNPAMAKVMHPLGGIPLIEHVVSLARGIGADPVIVVVGHQRESVIAYLESIGAGVRFAVQEEQLGTAHAVRMAEPQLAGFEGDVIILSGDAPLTRPSTLRDMIRRHRDEHAAVTVLTATLPDPTGYGRVVRDASGAIVRIVEHKDAGPEELEISEINSGIYVFRCDALFPALAKVTNDNAQGEYYLPDVFAMFRKDGRKMIPCVVPSFDEIRGVNTVEQLEELEQIFREWV
jgi:UDP-N-acetylglucosamine diphosphorylase/glucosamine-1-phosphate N-acetyltransferase